MKINLNQNMLTWDGDILKEGEVIVTLKDVCRSALNYVDPREKPEDVWKRAELIAKISRGGEIELEPEDQALIKASAVKRGHTPMECGQLNALITGKENPFKKPTE